MSQPGKSSTGLVLSSTHTTRLLRQGDLRRQHLNSTEIQSSGAEAHNRLNSERSAWMRWQAWYIVLISWMHCKYNSRPLLLSTNDTSLSLGAALPVSTHGHITQYDTTRYDTIFLHELKSWLITNLIYRMEPENKHLMHACFLGPQLHTQMAHQSVQPLLQDLQSCPTERRADWLRYKVCTV